MNYSIEVNSVIYPLPVKTLSITEKLDEVLKIDDNMNLSIKQKFDKIHKFVIEVLGEEKASEILGSEKLSEIDLGELSITARKINDAYAKPLEEYEQTKRAAMFDSIPIDQISKMTSALKDIK